MIGDHRIRLRYPSCNCRSVTSPCTSPHLMHAPTHSPIHSVTPHLAPHLILLTHSHIAAELLTHLCFGTPDLVCLTHCFGTSHPSVLHSAGTHLVASSVRRRAGRSNLHQLLASKLATGACYMTDVQEFGAAALQDSSLFVVWKARLMNWMEISLMLHDGIFVLE